MLIDWFTVAAQAVNFVILVALMKFFLYRPILKAMAERERGIADRLAAAEAERHKAASEAMAYREKNRAWTAQREGMQAQATKEVETEKAALLKQAHETVTVLQAKWQASIEHQKEIFLRTLRKKVTHQVYATARRALRDLANRDLELQMIDVFIAGLQALDQGKWKEIGDALREKSNEVILESAFEIPPEKREEIQGLLQTHLSEEIEVKLKTEAEFICGIGLNVPGHKIAWDLNDYLATLEEEISMSLRVETGAVQETRS